MQKYQIYSNVLAVILRITADSRKNLLFEMIEIAINPVIYMRKNNKVLDKNTTHAAIEILSNLSEEFT